jgi:hypothetical protein
VKFARRIFSFPNAVTIVTVIVGVAASAGLTEDLYSNEKVLIALVTLVATQLLLDRVGILTSIYDRIGDRTQGRWIELRPRSDPQFKRFADFAKDATEIVVIGIDLGFAANADAWFLKQALENGVRLKLLMVDPGGRGEFARVINAHDERNVDPGQPMHDHIAGARATLKTLTSLSTGDTRGTLEVRARVDIPNPTMAMVNPTARDGLIRVEIKPYKKNHGDVPYFILDRSSPWYEVFYEHYYVRLWNDSKVLMT